MKAALRFRSWRLGAKVVALLLAASTLPIMVLTWVEVRELRDRAQRHARALLAARADQLAGELDTFHAGYLGAAARFAQIPDLERLAAGEHVDLEAARAILGRFVDSDADIQSAAVLRADGEAALATLGPTAGSLVGARALVEDAIRSGVLAELRILRAGTGEVPFLIYAARIDGAQGRPVGAFVFAVRAAAFWDRVRDVNGRAGEDSHAIVLDRDGIRIAHSQLQDELFRPTGPVPEAARARLEARLGAKASLLSEPIALPLHHARATAGSLRDEDLEFLHQRDAPGLSRIVVVRRLERLPWTLFVAVPERTVEAPIEGLVDRTLALGAAVLLLALLAGLVLAARMLAPLRSLGAASTAIARGDLAARAQVSTGDELGQLGARFNEMAEAIAAGRENLEEKVRARTLELERANEELHAQQEELLAQQEELRAQHAELEAQQRELELKNREVARADRLKSEFLANMSHELRTPLNSIIGFSELVIEEGGEGLGARHRKFLEDVLASGRHLLGLINDILDLSKIEAGHLALSLQTVQPSEAVADATAIVQPVAAKKRIVVHERVRSRSSVVADPGKLRQILLNLLSNAVKFSPDGSEIEISAEDAGESVRFTVVDQGPGIDDAMLPRLFQAFSQEENPLVKQHQGTGLGLAITKRLVEMHGGTIEHHRALGGGARFTFTIPATDDGAREAPVDGGEPVILVVAEDHASARSLRSLLAGAGYAPRLLETGRDVPDAALESRSAAVVVDAQAERPDGIGAVDALARREETRAIPVVVTAAPSAAGFLPKPVEREVLLKALARHVAPHPTREPRVLCIDDDRRVGVLLSSFLEPAGYAVTTSTEPEAALAQALAEPPDAVIVDLMMPRMSGFELIDALLADPRTSAVPILVLTAADLTLGDRAWLRDRVRALAQKGSITREELVAAVDRATRRQRPAPARASDGHARTILVVDDHDLNRELARSILEKRGWRVLLAVDGEEGVEMARRHLPRMILLDLAMPKKNGYVAARELKGDPATAHIPIVALTALAMRGDEEKAYAAGIDGYLTKPIVREALDAAVARWASDGAP